jgi:hypothetical protein
MRRIKIVHSNLLFPAHPIHTMTAPLLQKPPRPGCPCFFWFRSSETNIYLIWSCASTLAIFVLHKRVQENKMGGINCWRCVKNCTRGVEGMGYSLTSFSVFIAQRSQAPRPWTRLADRGKDYLPATPNLVRLRMTARQSVKGSQMWVVGIKSTIASLYPD